MGPWRREQVPSPPASRTSRGQKGRLTMLVTNNSSGSRSVVPGPATSASRGNLLENQLSGFSPELLTQRVRRWSPAISVSLSAVTDCDAYLSLRTTVVHQTMGLDWWEDVFVLTGIVFELFWTDFQCFKMGIFIRKFTFLNFPVAFLGEKIGRSSHRELS